MTDKQKERRELFKLVSVQMIRWEELNQDFMLDNQRAPEYVDAILAGADEYEKSGEGE